MAGNDLSIEQLRELVEYDPDTGALTWREREAHWFAASGRGGAEGMRARWNARFAGKSAFETLGHDGHLLGRILGRSYRAQRVAWALAYGAWPAFTVDHSDGDPANNRLKNLRDVSHQVNMQNKAMQANNTSGVTGVCWVKNAGKWWAYIKFGGKRINLGYWAEFSDAKAAREAAERELGFSVRHGKQRV